MITTKSKLISGRSAFDPREGDLVQKKDEPTLVIIVTNRGISSFFAGTVLHSLNDLRPIGFQYNQWKVEDFIHFHGKIELNNL